MSAPSNVVVAAGLIIFRRLQSSIEYLLLQHSYGEQHWTPPKGHVDPGESEFQTALRETQEEAGFTEDQMKIIKDFEKNLHYTVKGKPKRVVYWLGELCNPQDPVKLSHEHKDFKWLGVEEACQLAKFPEMIDLLKEANNFISSQT